MVGGWGLALTQAEQKYWELDARLVRALLSEWDGSRMAKHKGGDMGGVGEYSKMGYGASNDCNDGSHARYMRATAYAQATR